MRRLEDPLEQQGTDPPSAAVFEVHRERLWRIAYGILSSPEDADDVVQEAYVRWHRADQQRVHRPEAWLVTAATRLCIDRLRARRTEREVYVGPWLPTPIVDPGPRPDAAAEIASELSLAFLVLLERLAPEERAAFLLREIFGVGYPDVAAALDRSEAACRQLVHRARERVRGDRVRFNPGAEEIQAMAHRFSAALEADDYDSLVALLSPGASYVNDGGGKVRAARRVVTTADRVARCMLGIARKWRAESGRVDRMGWVNGEPAILTYRHGVPIAATAFEVADGRIRCIYRVQNPEKLRTVPPL